METTYCITIFASGKEKSKVRSECKLILPDSDSFHKINEESPIKVVLGDPNIRGETGSITHFKNGSEMEGHACLYYDCDNSNHIDEAFHQAGKANASYFISSSNTLSSKGKKIPAIIVDKNSCNVLKEYCENKDTVTIKLSQVEEISSDDDSYSSGNSNTVSYYDSMNHSNPCDRHIFMRVSYRDKGSKKHAYNPFEKDLKVRILLPDGQDVEIPSSCLVVQPKYNYEKKFPVSFENDRYVKGKGCVCEYKNTKFINKVSDLCDRTAKVLFVISKPTKIKVPTVILNDIADIKKLTPFKQFQRSQYGYVEFSETPLFDDTQQKTKNHEKEASMKSNNVISLPKPKKQDTGFIPKYISNGISKGISYITGRQSIVSTKLQPRLEERRHSNGAINRVRFYKNMIDVLSEIYFSDHEKSEMEEAMECMKRHISCDGFRSDVPFISLCLIVHNISRNLNISTENFLPSIFKSIRELELDIDNDSFIIMDEQSLKDGYPEPSSVIQIELIGIIEMQYNSLHIQSSCITPILWLVSRSSDKFRDGFWPAICKIIEPDSIRAESNRLSKLFNDNKYILTLELLSQKQLGKFCEILTKYHTEHFTTKETVSILHPEFYQQVRTLISNVSTTMDNKDSLPELFEKFLNTLQLFNIISDDEEILKKALLGNLLRKMSFSQDTFGFSVLIECCQRLKVKVDHTYYDMAKECFQICVESAFRHSSHLISIEDTVDLLSSSCVRLLVNKRVEEHIWKYSDARVFFNFYAGPKLSQKTKFCECIFKVFLRGEISSNPGGFAKKILDNLIMTVKRYPSKRLERMKTLLDFSREYPDFLYCDPGIISLSSLDYVIDGCFKNFKLNIHDDYHIKYMKEVLKKDTDNASHSLQEGVKQLLLSTLKSTVNILDATILFTKFSEEGTATLITSADTIIIASFNRWNPKDIHDLLRNQSVDKLVDCLQHTFPTHDSSSSNTEKDRCLEKLKGIVSNWIQQYRDENLTYDEVSSVYRAIQQDKNKKETLKKIKGITDEFPEDHNFVSNIREFNIIQTQLYNSLVVNHSKNSIFNLLKKYKIQLDASDSLSFGIMKYEQYLEMSKIKGNTSLECTGIKLNSMRDDLSNLNKFRERYTNELEVMDYLFFETSILFQNELYLEYKSTSSMNAFLEKMRNTLQKLNTLFSKSATIGMIQNAANAITIEGGSVSKELEILRKCPELLVPNDLEVVFDTVEGLLNVRTPLLLFIRFCEQFSFALLKDSQYKELKEISEGMNEEILVSWCVTKCTNVSHTISRLLRSKGEANFESCRNLFEVFTVLSSCNEVWRFADERNWFGKDGLNNFYEEYRNVTNTRAGLGENSYEMRVLDSFEPAIRYVSAVGALKECGNFNEFLQSIQTDVDITKEVESGNRFAEITTSQTNILKIQEWFTEGMDDVAGILNKFNAIVESGTFTLHQNDSFKDSFEASLSLMYKVEKEDYVMSSKDIDDFVHNLGFIHDNDDVKRFIDKYHMVSKVSSLLVLMVEVGYIGVSLSDLKYETKTDQSAIQNDLKRYALMKNECDYWLLSVREKYPMGLLFWMEELKKINDLLTKAQECNESSTLLQHLLSRVFFSSQSGERSLISRNSRKVHELIKGIHLNNKGQNSWLVRVSEFVQKLHERFYPIGRPSQTLHPHSSQIIIHHIPSNSSTIQLIEHLYDKRLPRVFEILDGFLPLTRENIYTFLQRVERFHSNIFTILNTQHLSSEHQEMIVEFLSKQNTSSKNINIHFIQTQPTQLYSSPWVKEKSWDEDMLASEGTVSKLRDLVVDHKFIDEVMVVYSKGSCSGKTSFIQRKMQSIRSRSEINSINIHEGTTLTSLVHLLCDKFTYSSKTRAVHFSFTFDIYDEQNHLIRKLLLTLNHFFMSFLYLRNIFDPESKASFSVGEMKWQIFVELPSDSHGNQSHPSTVTAHPRHWLKRNIPALSLCCVFKEPPKETIVDKHMRRVGIYLRAFQDGTINRKFEKNSKRIVFVLDKSGSMDISVGVDANGTSRSCLDVVVDNTLDIFDRILFVNDYVSLVMFNKRDCSIIDLQKIQNDTHKNTLRRRIDGVRNDADGGTRMYSALKNVFLSIEQSNNSDVGETWIICLTDGASADTPSVMMNELQRSSINTHLTIIGVNLSSKYHRQMIDVTRKYGNESTTTKGFFLPTTAQISAIDDAFSQVAASIPVSQTFELDGKLNDADCVNYIEKFLPKFVPKHDKLLQKFFVEFMYRRVKVFDENEDFNFNEKYECLGSSLMEVMLKEVEQFLLVEQNKDWHNNDHHQLIYDFSGDSPEFRFISTSPDQIEPEMRKKLEALDLPGFRIPSHAELQKTQTLYNYLSQAMNIPLNILEDQIKSNKFVLTLDFFMKLLNIHERIVCRIPCILEGETGCSKTALTSMYSKLINSSLDCIAKKSTLQALVKIENYLRSKYFKNQNYTSNQDIVEKIRTILETSHDATGVLHDLLIHACDEREAFFCDAPDEFMNVSQTSIETVSKFLTWFYQSMLQPIFFEMNVHAALSEKDISLFFEGVQKVARRLIHTDALIVVFLDEVNTSSIMGLFKEVIIDRSICGKKLEANIVIVAAANPPRVRSTTQGGVFRENDLGKDWASGHYQVNRLPQSICNLKWNFGSLDSKKEKEFVYKRMDIIGDNMPSFMKRSLTELVSTSQEAIRSFAREHIYERLLRLDPHNENNRQEALLRSRSVVSLRDIQRVFCLFQFFLEFSITVPKTGEIKQRYRHSMLLTISVVYYLRLSSKSRKEFLNQIKSLPSERHEKETLLTVLTNAMNNVVKMSEIPPGIALTRGFKENIFMTLVCSLSRTPLMIIGPPGCSKTLSVNTVTDNANGQESMKKFYRELPRLQAFHYQCSKASTSTEVESIFKLAIQRQEKADPKKQLCMIFMDEAGLPEEEKESLKVLHYYLEDANVGFVGITNHVLDAAKSNRCASLLRPEPDAEELSCISKGVMFDFTEQECHQQFVAVDGMTFTVDQFSMFLCRAYADLLQVDWFQTFFGLRDFIYFLKCVKRTSTFSGRKMNVTSKLLLQALERNFSGIDEIYFEQLAYKFLQNVSGGIFKSESDIRLHCRHPMSIVEEALTITQHSEGLFQERYKLIIDQTDDDSIMRLLVSSGCLRVSEKHFFKLSCMPENSDLEKLNLVSGVKFAALQGNFAVLSQTESINESFYDLFNQHFRIIKNRDGKMSYYTNIAVGSMSRPSHVHPSFACVVHIRHSDLDQTPIPFLNRFEKYTLSVKGVLGHCLRGLSGLSEIVDCTIHRLTKLKNQLGDKGMCGWKEEQTLESIFVHMFGEKIQKIKSSDSITNTMGKRCICGHLLDFLTQFTSMSLTLEDTETVVAMGIKYLPHEYSDILQQLCDNGEDIDHDRIRQTLKSVMQSLDDSTSLATVARIILQMMFTRYVTLSFLLKISCPEAVFQNRNNLPEEIINEYFKEDHFNLKQYLHHIIDLGESKHHIIYTRTDSLVRSLPSWSSKADLDVNKEKYEKIKKLIHDDPDIVVVEHLCMLRSETSLRSAIESWYNDDTKSLFCLIIDMNKHNSIPMTNFVRSYIDNTTYENKSMVLLLHFPPSVNWSYPTLFLGNWSYFFLDGVGSDSSLNIKPWIRAACARSVREENKVADDITSSLQVMLPRCLFNLTSQNNFSHGQKMDSISNSLEDRYTVWKSLMEYDLGISESIEKLLCKKFRRMWTDKILSNIFNKSSNELVIGTSQLSISTSVSSIIQDTFNNFLMFHMKELSGSFTSNILLESKFGACAKTKQLCTLILNNLPIPPFQELMLHRRSSSQTQLVLSPRVEDKYASSAVFPFFHFISSFIDETIEKVDAELHTRENNDDDKMSRKIVCVQEVSKILSDMNTEDKISRKEVTEVVVDFVKESDYDNEDSLFMRYLKQYLYWKLGCKSLSVLLHWMMDKLEEMWKSDSGLKGNLLCIHTVCKNNEMVLIQLSSWTHADSFNLVEEILSKEGDISHICWQNLSGKSHLEMITENFSAKFGSKAENIELWMRNFSDFYRLRLKGMLGSGRLDDLTMIGQLRVLGFQYVIQKTNGPKRIMDAVFDRFYNNEGNKINQKARQLPRETSLNLFINIIESHDDNGWVKEAKFQLFKLFFSPDWLKCTYNKEYNDLDFLCSFIRSGKSSQNDLERIAAVSLRNFCMHSENSIETQAPSSMNQFLQPIADIVKYCDATESSGKNLLPKWMQSDSDNLANEEYMIIDDALLQAAFEIILCRLAEDIEERSLTSEDILLMIESETNELNVNTHVLQKVVVTATTICFVTKVAQELSRKNDTEVLAGVYGEEGSRVLKHLFNSESSWLVLLFSTMLRLKGEGYVYSNIESCEALISLGIIDDWICGIPNNTDGLIQALQKANQDLQEATNEEMKKAGEFRLCPYCNRAFGVAEMNCGKFTCGRINRHDNHGPNLGCGRPFAYEQARPYTINQEKLTELTNVVQEMTDRLNQNKENSQLWSKAKRLRVPILLFDARKYRESEPLLPSANLSHHIETSRSQHALASRQNKSCEFIKHIIDNMAHIEHFKGLERMIEFYLWLHINLKFLLSREQAYQYKMGDLMEKETLKKRFDESHVHHIMKMWSDVCASVSTFLKEQNHVVYWDCEEVKVPFSSLEDTSLVMMLSEGNHPTEGNDYLFLIINNIAEKYNSFATKINEYSGITDKAEEIHPKLLVDCRRGNLLNLFNIDLTSTIQHLSECFWLPEKCTYDFESLANELKSDIGTTSLIRSMMSTLREQFRFRNNLLADRNRDDMNGNDISIAFKSSTGDFFVRRHDLELFESTKQSMLDYGIDTGNPSIRKTLHVHFHSLGYDSLRHMLEGIRNVFDLLVSHKRTSKTVVFHTFEEAVNQASETETDKTTLTMMGFPSSISDTQCNAVAKLTLNDILEMVFYCGRQLARESFIFRELPLRFKEDLNVKSSSQIKKSIVKAVQERGEDQVLSELDEFVNDVLKFYMGPLVTQNQRFTMTSLRRYLKENNCCDESDPIFNILPTDVSTSNYVGLQLELYQLRLFVLGRKSMHKNNDDEDENCNSLKESFYSNPVRGSCWLWSNEQEDKTMDIDETEEVDNNKVTEDKNASQFFSNRLWFEKASIDNSLDVEKIDEIDLIELYDKKLEEEKRNTENDCELSFSASKIQQFWKYHRGRKTKGKSAFAYSINKADYMKPRSSSKKQTRTEWEAESNIHDEEGPVKKKLKYMPSFVEDLYNYTVSTVSYFLPNYYKHKGESHNSEQKTPSRKRKRHTEE